MSICKKGGEHEQLSVKLSLDQEQAFNAPAKRRAQCDSRYNSCSRKRKGAFVVNQSKPGAERS
ncbi:MAG: hypothetical protein DMG30_10590 [Acidobacteria bacterium]|nr:MAG: hypothetical protein DMG30_10590 [Acidobacteriota bacterium]